MFFLSSDDDSFLRVQIFCRCNSSFGISMQLSIIFSAAATTVKWLTRFVILLLLISPRIFSSVFSPAVLVHLGSALPPTRDFLVTVMAV